MASRFWVGGTGTWDASDTTHWAATSGGAGGQSVPGSGDTVTLDASSGGGTVTLGTSPNVTSITMGAFTGTLNFSTFSPTMQTFSNSGTGTRTLTMTNMGTLTLTGNNTNIWNCSTTTNLTLNPGGTIDCTYSGSVGTRSFNQGSGFPLNNLKVSAGSDTFATNGTGNSWNGNLDFTGFTGLWNVGTNSLGGNLTLGTGMTTTAGANTFTFTATSSKNITSNGVSFPAAITFNGVSGTWVLVGNFVSTKTLTFVNGTLDAATNNVNVTCTNVNNGGNGTKGINMGSGTFTLTGTSSTIWGFGTINGSNVVNINAGTSTIKITDTSNTALSFDGSTSTSNTYYNLWWSRGASTATNTIVSTNTFNDIKDDGTAAHSLVFPNVTTTVTTFSVSGTSGNLITLSRTGGSGTFILSKTSGVVSRDYLSISNSNAIGGATWYAGANSTDGGTNKGWQFSRQDVSKANFSNVF